MHPRAQFAPCATRAFKHRLTPLLPRLLVLLMMGMAPLRAQDAPPGTIGRVEGRDISVDGGTAASGGNATAAPSIFVSSGSVITVHSGQARMVLAAGGEVDICGPAKLTLLQSGGAITVALNFGRVHVILPVTTTLRIFTPTIVATPLEIRGERRDVTIGLDLSDSLCVLATSGALRLEHQFSGEILDVPQLGEFFLASGKLSPVAGVPGSCLCEEPQARATPAPVIPDVLPKHGAGSGASLCAAHATGICAGGSGGDTRAIGDRRRARWRERSASHRPGGGQRGTRCPDALDPRIQNRDATAHVFRELARAASRPDARHDHAGARRARRPAMAVHWPCGSAAHGRSGATHGCARRITASGCASPKNGEEKRRLLGQAQKGFHRLITANAERPLKNDSGLSGKTPDISRPFGTASAAP